MKGLVVKGKGVNGDGRKDMTMVVLSREFEDRQRWNDDDDDVGEG